MHCGCLAYNRELHLSSKNIIRLGNYLFPGARIIPIIIVFVHETSFSFVDKTDERTCSFLVYVILASLRRRTLSTSPRPTSVCHGVVLRKAANQVPTNFLRRWVPGCPCRPERTRDSGPMMSLGPWIGAGSSEVGNLEAGRASGRRSTLASRVSRHIWGFINSTGIMLMTNPLPAHNRPVCGQLVTHNHVAFCNQLWILCIVRLHLAEIMRFVLDMRPTLSAN